LKLAVNSNNQSLIDKLIFYELDASKDKNKLERKPLVNDISYYSNININVNDVIISNPNEAMVLGNISLFDNKNFSKHDISLYLIKSDGTWYIKQIPENYNFIELLRTSKIVTGENKSPSGPFAIRYSNSTQIQMKQYSSPDVWEISKNITNSYLGRNLFANNTELDMELYWYGNNWPDDVATFILDPVWQRIVYSKETSDDIKSYGDFYSHYKFSYPQAITMDENGNIYVADTGNKQIVRLAYSPFLNLIVYFSTLNIPILENPTDIAYSKNDSGDERLWILDGASGSIIETDINGSVLQVGEIYDFNPSRLYVNKKYPSSIYLMDPNSKVLMKGAINNGIFNASIIQFPKNSIITDIGTNPLDELYVSDSYYNCIHLFSPNLEYTSSLNYSEANNPAFQYPQRLSSHNFNKTGYTILENSTADRWSNTHGLKKFLVGADVFDLVYDQWGLYHVFNYFSTTLSSVRLEIIENGNIIKSENWIAVEGVNIWQFYNEIPLTTNLKFSVNYRPFYDQYYGDYEQGWKYKEITFSTAIPPIFDSENPFTQSPNIICKGSYGYVYANISPGNPPPQYTWEAFDPPTGAFITPQGS